MQNAIVITSPGTATISPTLLRAHEYAHAAKAHNTQRAYATHWREFETFAAARGYAPCPAPIAAIVEFVTDLAERGKRVATIDQKLAAIAFKHRAANVPSPTQTQIVREVMAGIRRTHGVASQQKAPVTRGELVKMIAATPQTLRGARDRAILLVGFAGAFRRSEIAGLDVEDVRFLDDEMIIVLRRSKTDQEGRGASKRLPALVNPALCPVRALRAWLDAAQIESGALFRPLDRWEHVRGGRLDDRVIALAVKEAAKRAGLEPRQFAGHSLRAGFVTQAAQDETPAYEIKAVTGHKSDAMVSRYIRDAGRGQVRAIRRAFGEYQNED
ncbi:site-specific integrase [Anaerolineae bacterium CFX7]|nr:site-specific integrase [Anaerolineae bacterium CFX7]